MPSETDKSFLVLFCKKERVALLRFQWVDLPGQLRYRQAERYIETMHAVPANAPPAVIRPAAITR